MLTGKLLRVRFARDRIVPQYIDAGDPEWRKVADRLLELFRNKDGATRGDLEEEISETFGDYPSQLVHQGLAKLLEDRCDFEVVSGHPPEELREAVFAAAQKLRTVPPSPPPLSPVAGERGRGERAVSGQLPLGRTFDRATVLGQIANDVGLTPETVDRGLFADLKSEQRLVRFKDISAERLLQRYNVSLAQGVLLRSTKVHVTIRGESPQRYRQLLRLVKFHRLVCEMERAETLARCASEGYRLHLDGPLSLFSATQKYGLQLALFLPAVLLCHDFELEAELRWGPQRKPKMFTLSPEDGLVSHHSDTGMYVPPELTMFVDLFRKKVSAWHISEETEIVPLGDGFWVPDFRLTHCETGRVVLLEVLGFWRRSSVEKYLERLRQHIKQPFLLAVSDQLHVDDADLEGLPAGIHRFRQMPLPDEVVRLANDSLSARGGNELP